MPNQIKWKWNEVKMFELTEIPISFVSAKGIHTATTTMSTTMFCGVRWMSLLLCCLSHDATRRGDAISVRINKLAKKTTHEKRKRRGKRVARGRIRRKETKRKQAAYIISIHTHWHFVPTDNNKNCIEPRGKQTIRYLYKCLSLHTHKHTHTYIGCSDACVHISFSISLNERTNVIKTKTNEIWRK